MVIKIDYLATLMEAKITVELRIWDLGGAILRQIYSQKWVGGRVSPTFARFSPPLHIWENEHF